MDVCPLYAISVLGIMRKKKIKKTGPFLTKKNALKGKDKTKIKLPPICT